MADVSLAGPAWKLASLRATARGLFGFGKPRVLAGSPGEDPWAVVVRSINEDMDWAFREALVRCGFSFKPLP